MLLIYCPDVAILQRRWRIASMLLSGQERHLSRPDRLVVDHASRNQQRPARSLSHRKKKFNGGRNTVLFAEAMPTR